MFELFFFKASRKKRSFFSGPATKRGGGGGWGVKDLATKRKDRFLKKNSVKIFVATEPEGGGCKALVAGPPKRTVFCLDWEL